MKQYHIIHERETDKYWFVLPDDTEIEISKNLVEKIDFNKLYVKLYSFYLSDIKKYNRMKEML